MSGGWAAEGGRQGAPSASAVQLHDGSWSSPSIKHWSLARSPGHEFHTLVHELVPRSTRSRGGSSQTSRFAPGDNSGRLTAGG